MTSLFLSYTRDDDKLFVERLYHDLTGLGFDAWWDCVARPSRGPTFLHEIRNATNERDR